MRLVDDDAFKTELLQGGGLLDEVYLVTGDADGSR